MKIPFSASSSHAAHASQKGSAWMKARAIATSSHLSTAGSQCGHRPLTVLQYDRSSSTLAFLDNTIRSNGRHSLVICPRLLLSQRPPATVTTGTTSTSTTVTFQRYASDALPLLNERIAAIVDSKRSRSGAFAQLTNQHVGSSAAVTAPSRRKSSRGHPGNPSMIRASSGSTARSMLRSSQLTSASTAAESSSPMSAGGNPPQHHPTAFPQKMKLTATIVRRMRGHDLRTQLSLRSLNITGKRPALVARLLAVTKDENEFNSSNDKKRDISVDALSSLSSSSSSLTGKLEEDGGDDRQQPSQDLHADLDLGADADVGVGIDIEVIDDDMNDTDDDLGFPVYDPHTMSVRSTSTASGAGTQQIILAPDEPLEVDREATYTMRLCGYTTRALGGFGVGMVVSLKDEEQQPLWSGQLYLPGDRTMFEAEYSAISLGIDYATTVLGIQALRVEVDNEIVVGQIEGAYKSNRESLRTLLKLISIQVEAKQDDGVLREFLGIHKITPVENTYAGRLARKAFAQRKTMLDGFDEWRFKDPVDVVTLSEERPTQSEGGKWADSDEEAKPNTAIDPHQTYLMQFDGGARGNPGIAGAGMVIYNENSEEIWCGWKYHDGPATNNVAEYLGLLCGLKCAQSLGIQRLIVEGDSQLIVRQINGEYRCKEAKLKEYYQACKKLLSEFHQSEIRHIRRAQNSRADWLANHAMDQRESDGFTSELEP